MTYEERLAWLRKKHQELIEKKNVPIEGNGLYERYANPVLTALHAPLSCRYEINKEANPYRMDSFGVHAVMNTGAQKCQGE